MTVDGTPLDLAAAKKDADLLDDGGLHQVASLLRALVDEVEALRAENERLRAYVYPDSLSERLEWKARYDDADAQIVRLNKIIRVWSAERDVLKEQAGAANARLAAVEAFLRIPRPAVCAGEFAELRDIVFTTRRYTLSGTPDEIEQQLRGLAEGSTTS